MLVIALAFLLAALFLSLFAIIKISLTYLGFSPIEGFWLLIIPLVFELPQITGRSIFLLVYELLYRWDKKASEDHRIWQHPRVSVIVPAYNEEEYIQRTIESIIEDTYPNKEIIVVDDGSTDKTYEKAMTYAYRREVKVIRREERSGLKACALNFGLLFASGDIAVIMDGDTILERDAIKELVKHLLKDPDVVGVVGNVRVFNRKGILGKLQAYEYAISMELGKRFQGIVNGIMVISGALGAVRRDVLESLGRIHVDTITEDFDTTVMLHKLGKRIAFSPRAVALTHVPDSWRSWVRQRLRWSAGQMQVYLRHSNIFFKRRFGVFGSIIAPNNVLMDMGLLFAKYVWLILLVILYIATPLYLFRVFLLILALYFALELWLIVPLVVLSTKRDDLRYAILAPIMIVFYRPLHSLIRAAGYISVLLGRRVVW